MLEGACPLELRCPLLELQCISSPLTEQLPHWRQALAGHPDGAFAQYVLNAIEHVFHVGFAHDSRLVSDSRNMRSATLHPLVINSYIRTELQEGRMVGPFPPGSVPGLHIKRMGVVPKGHTPGRWRLITVLSHPEGGSVNDGIKAELCSLRYTSVEAVAAAAQRLGRGARLAKLDIKSAYQLVPARLPPLRG